MKVVKLYPTITKANKGFLDMVKNIEAVTSKPLITADYNKKSIYIAGIDYTFIGAGSTYKLRDMRVDKVVYEEVKDIPIEAIQLVKHKLSITRGR